MPGAPDALAGVIHAAGVDAGAGVQIVDAARVPGVAIDPSVPLIVLRSSVPESAAPLPGRHAHRGAVDVLRALYPAGHALRDLESGELVAVTDIDDARLARADWLVPGIEPLANVASPHGLPWISARLRAPDGCPWDREQDHATLRRFVLEEAYETVDAIERGTARDLADELGDLLLQVVLHSQLAAESGDFDLTDVYRSIGTKIVRRHPHVFGDVVVSDADQVVRNWETIKAGERAAAPGGDRDGRFERLARALPALPASREIQERASTLGWDWPSVDGVWEKVGEELDELREAHAAERMHELGDVLFALVNLGRWLDLDPEEALRRANRRWIDRFHTVEAIARERGVVLGDLDAAEKDRLWDEAKKRRRSDVE